MMSKQGLLFFLVCFSFLKFALGQGAQNMQEYQTKIEKSLKDYRMPTGIIELPHYNQKYYTEAARKRLQELLEDEWKDEELDAFVRSGIRDSSSVKRKSNQLAKKTGKSYSFILDSLMNDYRGDMQIYLSKNTKVNNEVILTAGWLDDVRYIEILKRIMNDSLPNYNVNALKIALARFGVEPFYTQTLNANKINTEQDDYNVLEKKLHILFYLATQESIYEASKTLKIARKIPYIEENLPYYYFAIAYITFNIANLPYPFKGQQKYNTDDVYSWMSQYYCREEQQWLLIAISPFLQAEEKDIIQIHKWIEENKGNYVINRDNYTLRANWIK